MSQKSTRNNVGVSTDIRVSLALSLCFVSLLPRAIYDENWNARFFPGTLTILLLSNGRPRLGAPFDRATTQVRKIEMVSSRAKTITSHSDSQLFFTPLVGTSWEARSEKNSLLSKGESYSARPN